MTNNILGSMSPEVAAEFRAGIRRFLAEYGQPVLYSEPSYSYTEGPRRLDPREDEGYDPKRPLPRWQTDHGVSTYGWGDMEATRHCLKVNRKYPKENSGCHWIVPEGTQVKEVSISQFDGTNSPNTNDSGLHAFPCMCACGKYIDVVLRWEGSLNDILRTLFDYDPNIITL